MMIHTQQVAFYQVYERRKYYEYHNGTIQFQGKDKTTLDGFSNRNKVLPKAEFKDNIQWSSKEILEIYFTAVYKETYWYHT